jgi:hypothetical protein
MNDAAPPPMVAPAPAPAWSASNALFFEPLGNGLLYSVNYERFLRTLPVGLRAGASFFTYAVSKASGSGNLTLATFPLLASYYYGPSHHKLQLGLGATVIYFAASSDSTGATYQGTGTGLGVAATAVVGYRYLPSSSGITFGFGFTPLVRTEKGLLLWAGASAGYAF